MNLQIEDMLRNINNVYERKENIRKLMDILREEEYTCTRQQATPAGFEDEWFPTEDKKEDWKEKGTFFEGHFAEVIKKNNLVYKRFKITDQNKRGEVAKKECTQYNILDQHDDIKGKEICKFVGDIMPTEFKYNKKSYLQMKDNGDTLKSKIKDMDYSQYIDIIGQILDQLQCLHESNLAHLDIHLENVLVKKADDRYIARIIDYGLLIDEIKKDKQLHYNLSNVYYNFLSEMDMKNAQLSDIWALGLILLKMQKSQPICTYNFCPQTIYDLYLKKFKDQYGLITLSYTPFKKNTHLLKFISAILKYDGNEEDINRIKLIKIITYIFETLGNDNLVDVNSIKMINKIREIITSNDNIISLPPLKKDHAETIRRQCLKQYVNSLRDPKAFDENSPYQESPSDIEEGKPSLNIVGYVETPVK